jgi:hypothetical protein
MVLRRPSAVRVKSAEAHRWCRRGQHDQSFTQRCSHCQHHLHRHGHGRPEATERSHGVTVTFRAVYRYRHVTNLHRPGNPSYRPSPQRRVPLPPFFSPISPHSTPTRPVYFLLRARIFCFFLHLSSSPNPSVSNSGVRSPSGSLVSLHLQASTLPAPPCSSFGIRWTSTRTSDVQGPHLHPHRYNCSQLPADSELEAELLT